MGIVLTPKEIQAGVTVATVNGIEYYDYSNVINDKVYQFGLECQVMRLTFESNIYASSIWFESQVGAGKQWDIKNVAQWDKQFPGISFQNQFVLFGEVITPADLGNITYGYFATALGYGGKLTFWGGGYAQQKLGIKESLFSVTLAGCGPS